jgi:hypothetical protein
MSRFDNNMDDLGLGRDNKRGNSRSAAASGKALGDENLPARSSSGLGELNLGTSGLERL